MTFDFTGRRAVIAGGSRGIGRAIAEAFAAAGADVSICARGAAALEEARSALARHGRRVHAAPCDLADGAAVTRYVADAGAALGGIDILVNNASGYGLDETDAAWEAGFAVDIMAAVRASRAALPLLLQGTAPSIVNITSIAGQGPSLAPAYGAVKAALIHYTASLARQLARQGVRVNAVAPGSVEFPGGLWDERRRAGDPLYTRNLNQIPFGRMGLPEEIADVVLFLASPAARWVTGQTLAVDGGQMLGA